MRSLLIVLVCVTTAWAKPKVAVAPLAGDLPGNKLTVAVAEALADDFVVISGKGLAKSIGKQSGELDDDALKKAEKVAAAVVHGKVVKDGKKRSLQLKISVKGQDTSELVVKVKGTLLDDDSKIKIHDEVQRQLAAAEEADKPRPLTKRHEEADPKPEKRRDDEQRVAEKERAPEGEERSSKLTKKRRRKDHDEDEPARAHPSPNIFVDVGAAYGMRQLAYDSTAKTPPPKVSTAAPSGRVTGELFFKVAGATGALANFGLAGELDKAFGLSIALGQTKVPIDQGHYAIGARYRIDVGSASVVVLGADYAVRHYIADRSGLTAASQFDAPDVDYQSLQLDLGARTPFTPAIMGFATLTGILPFAAGPIQKSDSYGPANVYGVGLTAGVNIAVASQIAVHVAGEVDQISLSFKGTGGQAQSRMVTAATDRQLGLVASLALFY